MQKLYETYAVVDTMKESMTALEPQLQKQSADTARLMKHLVKEQAQADKVRQVVVADEAVVKVKAEETQFIADDAQRDLDAALPAMEAATKALEALNKNDINELKVFNKPPPLVKFVMESVCLLLGTKTDWPTAKIVLGDTNFLKKLQDYEKDKISEAMLKKLKEYVDHPDFIPDKVATQSKVCKSICMWVRAIDCYAKVFRVVQPKRKRLEQAERELTEVMAVLREKQQKLAEVEKQIAELEASYDRSVAAKKELEDNLELTANRLVRAGRLTSALEDEQVLWEKSVKEVWAITHTTCRQELSQDMVTMMGDVLVAAASVAYLGAFTSNYRDELISLWLSQCQELALPTSEKYSLINILADQFEIREWNTYGLPRDNVSTENGILVMHAGRWPLMIDPQEQANRWIRQMEAKGALNIVKLTDGNLMRILERSIRLGLPVLLEEVGEFLDPTLRPVLLKQTFTQGGRLLIRLGDSDVDYDDKFRLYLTTKLSNPHYLPEICIQVTIVNFTVTPSGLEDQLLSDVVRLERPDLEKQRSELIMRINNDKNQLENIEDKILRMLFASEGNILDNEELIDTLNESKRINHPKHCKDILTSCSQETAAIIEDRLIEAEATEENISIAREKYRVVATRGSVLYFVVAELGNIDPMYQYSLKYFSQVFNMVIETTEKSSDLEARLSTLIQEITLSMYTNVSRGLFERHKLVFSFMVCANILKHSGDIKEPQWNFLLRGPISTKQSLLKKPDVPVLSDAAWFAVCYLNNNFKSFQGLAGDAVDKILVSIGDFEQLMFAISQYVRIKLGQAFIESPPISLHSLYQDMSIMTPLVFVLSTGSDPFGGFQRFALEMGFKERVQSISLGQGQGPVAEKMIKLGASRGDWVFLQNCHLAVSWMLPMERMIQTMAETPDKIHLDFRLFLSSMPSRSFPVSVLQNSVKVTNEPPLGLRANIRRAFTELDEDFFEDHPLSGDWRRMVFGICFFHGVIQERKKFGPLGWNITYEFNDSDRECALNTMKMFCTGHDIPWDALEYITGEITYGGRVTDYWDLRCLKTILKCFFAPHTLKSGYMYSTSESYYCPEAPGLQSLDQYREFIDQLPLIEGPDIFGMHENANIAFQYKETQAVIGTIVEVQPRESGGTEGRSTDDIVFDLADDILRKLPELIDPENTLPPLLRLDSKGRLPSLSTVVLQEADRYNKLLVIIHASLDNLQKAIRGFVVMSEALEEVFKACLNNQVPKMWSSVSYPSLKSLGSWIQDLLLRLDFIETWLQHGPPVSYWLSGFFFPQGFLTGTLQTHARKYDLPIDELIFDFKMGTVVLDQNLIRAKHLELHGEAPELYSGLDAPPDGVWVHGLFLDAARWDFAGGKLADPNPGEMNPPLPVMMFMPKRITDQSEAGRYICPLYKTSIRAGVLSTTGHSTNFVVSVLLPTEKQQSYWILKGSALLTQITD
uniref:(California timema) hypothetical protein n=1 Tax=Timema californicum TaxID=61474 RepID=A0A7R9IYP9_TIMCA|nr:unnamed protein product [Timema californicum]